MKKIKVMQPTLDSAEKLITVVSRAKKKKKLFNFEYWVELISSWKLWKYCIICQFEMIIPWKSCHAVFRYNVAIKTHCKLGDSWTMIVTFSISKSWNHFALCFHFHSISKDYFRTLCKPAGTGRYVYLRHIFWYELTIAHWEFFQA